MQKKSTTKEITGSEADVENKRVPDKLRCIREAVMPHLGHFHVGDVIDDKRTIELIADNPNFVEEEQS